MMMASDAPSHLHLKSFSKKPSVTCYSSLAAARPFHTGKSWTDYVSSSGKKKGNIYNTPGIRLKTEIKTKETPKCHQFTPHVRPAAAPLSCRKSTTAHASQVPTALSDKPKTRPPAKAPRAPRRTQRSSDLLGCHSTQDEVTVSTCSPV